MGISTYLKFHEDLDRLKEVHQERLYECASDDEDDFYKDPSEDFENAQSAIDCEYPLIRCLPDTHSPH